MNKNTAYGSLGVFFTSFIVYILTLSPSVSFWDSGDFITAGYSLDPSHPPGSPIYILLSRIINIPFSGSTVGVIFNLFSALTCSFSSSLVFLIIQEILKGAEYKKVRLGAGVVGALSLSFLSSVWAIATVAEIYGLSLSMALINVLLILKGNNRRIILLNIFIWSLSVGVHQLNLGMIFPITLMIYLNHNGFKVKHVFFGMCISIIATIVSVSILFKGLFSIGNRLDIWLVNEYGFTYNSGVYLLFSLLLLILSFLVWFFKRRRSEFYETVSFSIILILFGFSSYALLTLNSSSIKPSDFQLNTLNRLEQYINSNHLNQFSERPLLFGSSYNSPIDPNIPLIFGDKVYSEWEDKYLLTDDGYNSKVNYVNEFDSFFPRMIYRSPIDNELYRKWVNLKGPEILFKENDERTRIRKVRFIDNLEFFFKFQLGWASYRYILKNFVGSQNSNLSDGNIINGNWITGFNSIDSLRLGDSELTEQLHDKSRNPYFGLPLLFVFIGFIYSVKKHKKIAILFFSIFLLYTIGLPIYLNTGPFSLMVRERDYIFLIPISILTIGIGLSVAYCFQILSNSKDIKRKALVSILIVSLCVPVQLLSRNWDDQNNNDDWLAYELARSYLQSCQPNAVLITNGDNATYPLWYLQEVEGFRQDVRVINYDLLYNDWYVKKVTKENQYSPKLNFWINADLLLPGKQKRIPYHVNEKSGYPWELSYLTEHITANRNQKLLNDKKTLIFPGQQFLLHSGATNEERNLGNFTIRKMDKIVWTYKKNIYSISDLILFDVIAHNYLERPFYFTNTGSYAHTLGLDPYTIEVGLVKKLEPVITSNQVKIVEENIMTETLLNNSAFDFSTAKYYSQDHKNIAAYILRPSYYYFADFLIEKGERDKAKLILDQCLLKIPNEQVPFSENMFDIARLYYKIGDPQSARKIVEMMIDNLTIEVKICISSGSGSIFEKDLAGKRLSLIGFIIRRLRDFDKQFAEFLDNNHDQLEEEYSEWFQHR